jgi:hypothetical protein
VGAISETLRSRMIGAAILACVGVADGAAAASEQRLTYTVQMLPYGTIGNYQSVKHQNGDGTTITTEAHIKVSLAGIVLYRLETSRVERQVADRLVYFHGVTIENGKSVEVAGKAVGERFIITSPSGTVTAPGTIRISDPWSAGAPGVDTVLMPDTGVVTRVHTSGGEQTSMTIGGASVPVRRYQINSADGGEQYEVWMDDQRTPVMFNIADRDGTTTFTLIR